MDFYTHLYAKPAQTAVAQDEQPKEEDNNVDGNESSPTAKDGFFGLFNRSQAAKKGWDTRKQNGGVTSSKQWTPGVWPKKSTSTSTSTTSSGTSHVTSSGTSHSTTGSSVLSNLPKHLTRPKSCTSEIDANRSMFAASKDEHPEEIEDSKSEKKLSAEQLVAMRKKAGLPIGKKTPKAEDEEPYSPKNPKPGKYGLSHEDGSPCNAKTPDSCPHNKKARKVEEAKQDADKLDKGGKYNKNMTAAQSYLDSLKEKAMARQEHLDECENKIASYWKDKVKPLKDGEHIPDLSKEERKAIYDIVDNDVPNEGDYDERDIDNAIDNSLEDGNDSHKEFIEDVVSRVSEINTKNFRKRNGFKD